MVLVMLLRSLGIEANVDKVVEIINEKINVVL